MTTFMVVTHLTVYTDNNPLTYVLSTAKLDACSHRWVARLANYNFNIQLQIRHNKMLMQMP